MANKTRWPRQHSNGHIHTTYILMKRQKRRSLLKQPRHTELFEQAANRENLQCRNGAVKMAALLSKINWPIFEVMGEMSALFLLFVAMPPPPAFFRKDWGIWAYRTVAWNQFGMRPWHSKRHITESLIGLKLNFNAGGGSGRAKECYWPKLSAICDDGRGPRGG